MRLFTGLIGGIILSYGCKFFGGTDWWQGYFMCMGLFIGFDFYDEFKKERSLK